MRIEDDYQSELEGLTERAKHVTPETRARLLEDIRTKIRFHRTWLQEATGDPNELRIRYKLVAGHGGPEQKYVDAYETLLKGLGEMYPMLGIDREIDDLVSWYATLNEADRRRALLSFEWYEFLCRDALAYLNDPSNRAILEDSACVLEERFGHPVDVRKHFAAALAKVQRTLGRPGTGSR